MQSIRSSYLHMNIQIKGINNYQIISLSLVCKNIIDQYKAMFSSMKLAPTTLMGKD